MSDPHPVSCVNKLWGMCESLGLKPLPIKASEGDRGYMSPSSLAKWIWDRDDWVRCYRGGYRQPSTVAMDIGTWFDRLVKKELTGYDDDVRVCEEAQIIGDKAYQYYRESGLLNLRRSIDGGAMICEDSLCVDTPAGPILGKPDLVYQSLDGPVVLDWKCNGLASAKGRSPTAGYIEPTLHKNAQPKVMRHIMVNDVGEWKLQVNTYALLVGATIGRIHQLTHLNGRYRWTGYAWLCDQGEVSIKGFGPSGESYGKWNTRYQCEIGCMDGLLGMYHRMWTCIQEDYVYPWLTLQESRRRAQSLAGHMDEAYTRLL